MTHNPAVERVVTVLSSSGFVLRPQPVRLGAIEFDFAAVMTAERGLDLVVVADTAEQSIDRVSRSLEGLSRALDRMSSRRPITVVLVGPRPAQGDIDVLARSGRVLVVGSPQGDAEDKSAGEVLSILLPLDVPDVASDVGATWQKLTERLDVAVGPRIAQPLLEASARGVEGVRTAMRGLIVEAIEDQQESHD